MCKAVFQKQLYKTIAVQALIKRIALDGFPVKIKNIANGFKVLIDYWLAFDEPENGRKINVVISTELTTSPIVHS